MPGRTILAIDDNIELGRFIEKILSRAGFRVVLAKSGEEGLSHYHQEPVRAVLLDLNLPDACGADILALLRVFNPNVRCAMMHGGSLEFSDEELLAAGAAELLLKPFTPENLLAVARRLTGSAETVSVAE